MRTVGSGRILLLAIPGRSGILGWMPGEAHGIGVRHRVVRSFTVVRRVAGGVLAIDPAVSWRAAEPVRTAAHPQRSVAIVGAGAGSDRSDRSFDSDGRPARLCCRCSVCPSLRVRMRLALGWNTWWIRCGWRHTLRG